MEDNIWQEVKVIKQILFTLYHFNMFTKLSKGKKKCPKTSRKKGS